MAVLSAHDLTIGFEADGINNTLLENLSLDFRSGQIYQLQGENGMGKTRLLETLAGVYAPLSGRITLTQPPLYIAHQNSLKPVLTVAQSICQHVELFCNQVWGGKAFLNQLDCALEALNLTAYKHTRISALSHGQKRKVALARLWFDNQPLWLLDEPFAGLDTHSADVLHHTFHTHKNNGGCVVFTHHAVLTPDLGNQHTPCNTEDIERIHLHTFCPKQRVADTHQS